MNTIAIGGLRPADGGAARFEGHTYGAPVSCFVVTSAPGRGAETHRHPYEEVFVILKGEIEVTVAGETQIVSDGTIVVIPANAWHGFKNRSDQAALMVNVHPRGTILQEQWLQEEKAHQQNVQRSNDDA